MSSHALARVEAATGRTVLPGAIAFVVLGFLAASVYVETRAAAIDRETVLIETNSLPSVELIGLARASLWRANLAVHEFAEEEGERRREAGVAIDQARAALDRALGSEFTTGAYPGETELQEAATRDLRELDGLVTRLREAAVHDNARELLLARNEVRAAVARTDEQLEKIAALNASEGHAQVSRIARARQSSLRTLFTLNAACVALAAFVATLAVRSMKRQRQVELAHDAMMESRAAELDGFASRVAHDILSPLSALHFTLVTLQRHVDRGLPVAEPIERAWACLRRSRALVEGVMDFARSGAKPAGGRTSLRSTLEGVIEEARTGAPEVEFIVEDIDPDVLLACSGGVLLSILSNLVGNAVKHSGARADKRVTVRGAVRGRMVRVTVEDNGSGLPPGLASHVFEPYVRSPESRTVGLGLGLATVLRFAESHGGSAGVESTLDQGCTFWFQLPRADG